MMLVLSPNLMVEYVFRLNIKIIKPPLLWRCSKNHTWCAPLRRVKNCGTWCPHCAGNVKHTFEDIRKIALSKHGECLSTKYKNNQLPLLWRCKENHLWHTSLGNVKNGKWCPFCYRFKREQLCREIVTKYLGPPSENRRPDFLKIPEHPKGIELDIPYYEYGFAIEVQGEQHEKYIEFFHRGDPNNFIKQQTRDQHKKELCEENCIALRYVWYYEDPYVVIPEHLRELGLIE